MLLTILLCLNFSYRTGIVGLLALLSLAGSLAAISKVLATQIVDIAILVARKVFFEKHLLSIIFLITFIEAILHF